MNFSVRQFPTITKTTDPSDFSMSIDADHLLYVTERGKGFKLVIQAGRPNDHYDIELQLTSKDIDCLIKLLQKAKKDL